MPGPIEPNESNYHTFILWAFGFIVASFVLSLLGVLVPWHALRVVFLMLSYAAEFGVVVCFIIGGWKAIRIWRYTAQQNQAKARTSSQNGTNT